jgi:hypothetical protein
MVKYFECTLPTFSWQARCLELELRLKSEDKVRIHVFTAVSSLLHFPFIHFPELVGVNCLGTILTIVWG